MGNLIQLVLDFLTILVDTCNIYLKNGRLMAFLAALFISCQTMLLLANIFSITPFISDLINKNTTSVDHLQLTNGLTDMRREVIIVARVEFIFILLNAIARVFFTITTTHAAALIHGGKKTSIKDLALRTIRSVKGPFVTCFYITLLRLGFLFLCVISLLPLVLIHGYSVISSYCSAILLSISAILFYNYLSVVWNLSLVVSILEEKSGIEALGKAAEIVKSMKLLGFILRLVLANILPLILLLVFPWMMNFTKQSEAIIIVMALLELYSIRMVGMFVDVAYTVLYYKCKKSHGEKVELEADMDTKNIAAAAPLLNENIL